MARAMCSRPRFDGYARYRQKRATRFVFGPEVAWILETWQFGDDGSVKIRIQIQDQLSTRFHGQCTRVIQGPQVDLPGILSPP